MEWIIALGIGFIVTLLLGFYLGKKILRVVPKLRTLVQLSKQLEVASQKVVALDAAVSALGEDPAVHQARRSKLLAQNRKLKRQRERRLRNRDF